MSGTRTTFSEDILNDATQFKAWVDEKLSTPNTSFENIVIDSFQSATGSPLRSLTGSFVNFCLTQVNNVDSLKIILDNISHQKLGAFLEKSFGQNITGFSLVASAYTNEMLELLFDYCYFEDFQEFTKPRHIGEGQYRSYYSIAKEFNPNLKDQTNFLKERYSVLPYVQVTKKIDWNTYHQNKATILNFKCPKVYSNSVGYKIFKPQEQLTLLEYILLVDSNTAFQEQIIASLTQEEVDSFLTKRFTGQRKIAQQIETCQFTGAHLMASAFRFEKNTSTSLATVLFKKASHIETILTLTAEGHDSEAVFSILANNSDEILKFILNHSQLDAIVEAMITTKTIGRFILLLCQKFSHDVVLNFTTKRLDEKLERVVKTMTIDEKSRIISDNNHTVALQTLLSQLIPHYTLEEKVQAIFEAKSGLSNYTRAKSNDTTTALLFLKQIDFSQIQKFAEILKESLVYDGIITYFDKLIESIDLTGLLNLGIYLKNAEIKNVNVNDNFVKLEEKLFAAIFARIGTTTNQDLPSDFNLRLLSLIQNRANFAKILRANKQITDRLTTLSYGDFILYYLPNGILDSQNNTFVASRRIATQLSFGDFLTQPWDMQSTELWNQIDLIIDAPKNSHRDLLDGLRDFRSHLSRKDPKDAAKILTQLLTLEAKNQSAELNFALGQCYEQGTGTSKDTVKAVSYFAKAFDIANKERLGYDQFSSHHSNLIVDKIINKFVELFDKQEPGELKCYILYHVVILLIAIKRTELATSYIEKMIQIFNDSDDPKVKEIRADYFMKAGQFIHDTDKSNETNLVLASKFEYGPALLKLAKKRLDRKEIEDAASHFYRALMTPYAPENQSKQQIEEAIRGLSNCCASFVKENKAFKFNMDLNMAAIYAYELVANKKDQAAEKFLKDKNISGLMIYPLINLLNAASNPKGFDESIINLILRTIDKGPNDCPNLIQSFSEYLSADFVTLTQKIKGFTTLALQDVDPFNSSAFALVRKYDPALSEAKVFLKQVEDNTSLSTINTKASLLLNKLTSQYADLHSVSFELPPITKIHGQPLVTSPSNEKLYPDITDTISLPLPTAPQLYPALETITIPFEPSEMPGTNSAFSYAESPKVVWEKSHASNNNNNNFVAPPTEIQHAKNKEGVPTSSFKGNFFEIMKNMHQIEENTKKLQAQNKSLEEAIEKLKANAQRSTK